MNYYDVHIHRIGEEIGGILIALEGTPKYDGVFSNCEIEQICKSHPQYIPAYYITKYFNDVPDEKILKYHPYREQYSSKAVINDLKKRKCKLCIIDTLNAPNWSPNDYSDIIQTFPHIKFILAHMGGYDILQFVKILEFNRNVYADFSLTQEYFGWCGDKTPLTFVIDLINYCLNKDKLRARVLFGSDYPFYSQKKAITQYEKYPNVINILTDNYKDLLNDICNG
jgi:hypothetical protein